MSFYGNVIQKVYNGLRKIKIGTITIDSENIADKTLEFKSNTNNLTIAGDSNGTVTFDLSDQAEKRLDQAATALQEINSSSGAIAITNKNQVGLKLNNQGNVQLTQDTNGLKANVTFPTDYDTKYHLEYDSNNKQIKLVTGVDNSKMIIDATPFIKDGMIQSVILVDKDASGKSGQFLKITWNTDSGHSATYVDISSLIDINELQVVITKLQQSIEDNNVFETDVATVNALGGIAADADLNGLTTHEILRKLLYPYVDATIGNATATPNGGIYEHGTTKTITQVKITVTKKSEPITSVALYNGSTLIEEKSGDAVKNGGTIVFSGVGVRVPSDGNQLTVKVTYPDANGNAKTVEKKTTALTFVYPYYIGVCNADAIINEALIEGLTKKVESKGTKTCAFTTNNQKMIFAYPTAYGAIKKIIDQNGFDNTNAFTRSEITITGLDKTSQPYYVYTNDPSSVTGFNLTFSY